jgi:preprotein translocase subunit SecE
MSHARYVILSFIVGAFLVGWTLQVALYAGFAQFDVPDNRVLGLLNYSTIGGVIGAVATFGLLIRNPKVVSYSDEVVSELGKVTWPTREETIRATTTVIYTTLFVSALLGAYDFVWKNIADVFLFQEV